MSILKRVVFMLGVLSFWAHVHGQTGSISNTDMHDGHFKTGHALSMGGAYRALANSAQAVLYNPAGMKLLKQNLSTVANYAYPKAYASHQYDISAVDTATSQALAYGTAYFESNPNIGGIKAKNRAILLSMAYGNEKFFLGASAKGYWVKVDHPTIEGPRGIDTDVGFLFKPMDMLSIGVVGYNLVLGRKIEEYPLKLAGALALNFGDGAGALTFDLVKNFNTPNPKDLNFHFGGRYLIKEKVALSGGFVLDEVLQNNYYTLGLGVSSKQAEVYASFAQTIGIQSEIYTLGLSYFM